MFHNNAPSALRPRHRNHHVSSQIVVDARGREHMLLHFFVQGRPPGSAAPAHESYAARAAHWTSDTAARVAEMSFGEMAECVRARGESALENAKQVFRFLSGDAATGPRQPPPTPQQRQQRAEEKDAEGGWTSAITGLFSGLRGPSTGGGVGDHASSPSDGTVYTDGEVHADLVMVCLFLACYAQFQ